jgi:hypothetical protein
VAQCVWLRIILWLTNNDWRRIWRQTIVSNLNVVTETVCVVLRRTTKKLKSSQCLGKYSNSEHISLMNLIFIGPCMIVFRYYKSVTLSICQINFVLHHSFLFEFQLKDVSAWTFIFNWKHLFCHLFIYLLFVQLTVRLVIYFFIYSFKYVTYLFISFLELCVVM